jgi:hypothetical protein
MKVRVELRRDRGRWIARYRKRAGVVGDLTTRRKVVHDRGVYYLTLDGCESTPELYEPRVTEIFGDEMRFSGWEQTADLAWVMQEWDVVLLPEPRVD